MRGGRSPAGSPSYKLRQPCMRLGTWLLQRHAADDASLVPPMGRAQVLLHMPETPDAGQSDGTGRETVSFTEQRAGAEQRSTKIRTVHPQQTQTASRHTRLTSHRGRGRAARPPPAPPGSGCAAPAHAGHSHQGLRRNTSKPFMSSRLVRPRTRIRQPVSLQHSSLHGSNRVAARSLGGLMARQGRAWVYLSMKSSALGTLWSPRWMTALPTHCPSCCTRPHPASLLLTDRLTPVQPLETAIHTATPSVQNPPCQ